jgi:raffinose/stachyose/melibiose transport system substrate-binding protein
VNRYAQAVTLGALSLLLTAACSAPGSALADGAGENVEAIDSPVTAEQVAELGDVELSVWAEAGEEQTLKRFVPEFEKRYPNVEVSVTVKSIDDLITTVVNAMAGDNPPDVAQGNQGYAVDGKLVEAGLVRQLDDVAEVYDWSETIGDQLLGPMRWDGSGRQFRSGSVYAASPVANNIGVFYNEAVLGKAGVEVPTTFTELERALAAVKEAGELPIMMGNAEKWPALHVFGAIQGAFADPHEVNDWVSGTEGATFETDANRTAAQTLSDWEDAGYFGSAYNGIGIDDAATRFGRGEGAFFIAGDWYAPAVIDGGGDTFGFMAPPVGESGEPASTGSLSFPWHISSQTEVLPAAIAFLAEMHAPENAELLVDVNRIPVIANEVQADGEMAQDLIKANQALMAAGGQMDYLDWSTPTMYDTLGSGLQRLLADRITPEAFLAEVQQDWESFQANR